MHLAATLRSGNLAAHNEILSSLNRATVMYHKE
jgi:hypothetical protein